MKIDLADVKRYLRVYIKPKNHIKFLTFFITNACNLRCHHCFYWQELGHRKDELTLDEITRIAASIGPFEKLSITGGEPFLDRNLVDIARIFHETNRVRHLTIPTNGLSTNLVLNFSEQILKDCPDLTLYIAVSFDGLKEKHNEIRGVPKSFDTALATLEQLKELRKKYPRLILGVTITLCSVNQDEIGDAYQFFRTVGVNTVTVNAIRGDVKDPSYKDFDLNAYKKVTALIKQDLRERKLNLTAFFNLLAVVEIMKYDFITRYLEQQKMIVPCVAGKFNAILHRNGDVFPCEILNKKFGNIRDFDYDFGKVLESMDAREIRRWIRDSHCACTHECMVNLNMLLHARFLPKIALNLVKFSFS